MMRRTVLAAVAALACAGPIWAPPATAQTRILNFVDGGGPDALFPPTLVERVANAREVSLFQVRGYTRFAGDVLRADAISFAPNALLEMSSITRRRYTVVIANELIIEDAKSAYTIMADDGGRQRWAADGLDGINGVDGRDGAVEAALRDGQPGAAGRDGAAGHTVNAGTLILAVGKVTLMNSRAFDDVTLTIRAPGPRGGDGGQGGDGGRGGDGGGAFAGIGAVNYCPDPDCPGGKLLYECFSTPTNGGDAGAGGRGGRGGDAGDGGAGGDIIFVGPRSVLNFFRVARIENSGGAPGAPGRAGRSGRGGSPGSSAAIRACSRIAGATGARAQTPAPAPNGRPAMSGDGGLVLGVEARPGAVFPR